MLDTPRTFLLSPASTAGKRAQLLFNTHADFGLARQLRSGEGAPLGEVFSFLSSVYFRGKLLYAKTFAGSGAAIRVITSDRGLVDPERYVTLEDIRTMSAGAIDQAHEPYRMPLERDARALLQAGPPTGEVVLLGSIATGKYVDVLAGVFGARLVFPTEFVGRGDMSRGGLMLRCAREGRELDYAPVMSAIRRGTRPPKLASASSPARAKAAPPKANRRIGLPLGLDYPPMEAKPVTEIPIGSQWQYEPKWDGFRCLAFRDGDAVELMSKASKPLTRYFPEVVNALRALPPSRFVLDGEIVIASGDTLQFDELLQRIHPAASRINKLSIEHPATYILFDMLVSSSGKPLADEPLSLRRKALEALVIPPGIHGIRRSPATRALRTVQRWFKTVGSGLDGIVAKRLDLPYQSGERTGMQKLKHTWTADCVVGGFRYATSGKQVGSLLLGLYNDQGKLDHVGFLSGIRTAERAALTRKLEGLVKPPGFTGNAPGGPSRWSTERSTEWEPLAPNLVVEVTYDHFTGGRFRHGTRLVRWRPDKAPRQCTMDQMPRKECAAIALLE